jgi:hypothetical protein
VDKYGFFGPSLDYSNPEEKPEEMEFPEDGMKFMFSSCNHGEVPLDDEGENFQQLVLEDQGILPPPWARFPETFNIDIHAEGYADSEVIEGEFEFERMPLSIAANPSRLSAKDIRELIQEGEKIGYTAAGHLMTGQQAQTELGVGASTLLSTNPKLEKGGIKCFVSAGFNGAPFSISGIANLCPYATKGCSAACLNISGKAEVSHRLKYDFIREARIRRTLVLFNNPALFAQILERAMGRWQNKAYRAKTTACARFNFACRMNVLSDLPWEDMVFPFDEGAMTVFERFSDVPFYDYTKNPYRMMRFLRHLDGQSGDWPDNYWLTFSWSEVNARTAFEILQAGGNVAIPFDLNPRFRPKPKLPEKWCGFPVIDSDEHDVRFLEYTEGYRGVFCGLRMKGNAVRKKFTAFKEKERIQDLPRGTLTGGFFQYADEAGVVDGRHYHDEDNITNSMVYVDEIIGAADQRAEEQASWVAKMRSRFSSSPAWWEEGLQ